MPTRLPIAIEERLTAAEHAQGVERMPTLEELMEQDFDGVVEATDGCQVEPDGTCPHGCRSWMLVLRII